MEEVRQKHAVITGVSSGIGHAVATTLLDLGWRVTGVSRRASEVFKTTAGYTSLDVDLSLLDQLTDDFKSLSAQSVDSLICCAGYGRFGCIEEFSLPQIQRLMNVNFTAHAWLVRQLIPGMKRSGQGDIIFLGSESALSGGKKGAIYSASKFALRGFAQALRDESSRNGVRVSIINPGMVTTPFFERLDFAPGEAVENAITPDAVAKAVLTVLDMPPGTVIDEINLSPLKKVIQSKKP